MLCAQLLWIQHRRWWISSRVGVVRFKAYHKLRCGPRSRYNNMGYALRQYIVRLESADAIWQPFANSLKLTELSDGTAASMCLIHIPAHARPLFTGLGHNISQMTFLRPHRRSVSCSSRSVQPFHATGVFLSATTSPEGSPELTQPCLPRAHHPAGTRGTPIYFPCTAR